MQCPRSRAASRRPRTGFVHMHGLQSQSCINPTGICIEMRHLFASSQGAPPWTVQKTEYSAPWAPTAITNDKTTRLQQCCRSSQSRNSVTPPHSSIARPQGLSMGARGPLRPIHNVMHFSELAEYSQKCTLGSAPPIRSGQHALVLPVSGH